MVGAPGSSGGGSFAGCARAHGAMAGHRCVGGVKEKQALDAQSWVRSARACVEVEKGRILGLDI